MSWIYVPAQWMRGHLPEITLSITAMFFVVVGPAINAGMKGLARKWHWLLRYALFVVLSTVGYGILTNIGLRGARAFLTGLGGGQLLVAVLGAHLIFAWLLKRDRKI